MGSRRPEDGLAGNGYSVTMLATATLNRWRAFRDAISRIARMPLRTAANAATSVAGIMVQPMPILNATDGISLGSPSRAARKVRPPKKLAGDASHNFLQAFT